MHQLITGLVHSKEPLIKSPPAEDDLFRGSLVKTFYHAAGEKARATPHNLARRLSQMGGAHQTVNRHSGMEPHPLPLPLGEVAERSEDGAGKQGCNALSHLR